MSQTRTLIVSAIILASLSAVAYLLLHNNVDPPKAVDYVDLGRYAGTWYEISRFYLYGERNCKCTYANYTLRPDGVVGVENHCINFNNGQPTSVVGTASVDNSDSTVKNSKLRVTFFWPFSAQYWVVDLDEQYRWAVVSESTRTNLWILSRTKTLDQSIYNTLVNKLKLRGFDTSKLIVQDQSC